jgi:hypothetical protein
VVPARLGNGSRGAGTPATRSPPRRSAGTPSGPARRADGRRRSCLCRPASSSTPGHCAAWWCPAGSVTTWGRCPAAPRRVGGGRPARRGRADQKGRLGGSWCPSGAGDGDGDGWEAVGWSGSGQMLTPPDFVGLRGDGDLGQDDAGAGVQRGEQVYLATIRPAGTTQGLAVDSDDLPVPRSGCDRPGPAQ